MVYSSSGSQLPPRQFYALLALAEQPLHGYRLMLQGQKDSGRSVVPSPARIYADLNVMLEEGLIKGAGTEPAERSRNKRHLYAITELGRVVLGEELDRLAQVVRLGRSRLGRVD